MFQRERKHKCKEIIYPFAMFYFATVDVWEWIGCIAGINLYHLKILKPMPYKISPMHLLFCFLVVIIDLSLSVSLKPIIDILNSGVFQWKSIIE